jgi:hypothetical protein
MSFSRETCKALLKLKSRDCDLKYCYRNTFTLTLWLSSCQGHHYKNRVMWSILENDVLATPRSDLLYIIFLNGPYH